MPTADAERDLRIAAIKFAELDAAHRAAKSDVPEAVEKRNEAEQALRDAACDYATALAGSLGKGL